VNSTKKSFQSPTIKSKYALNFAIEPATIQRVILELISQGTYGYPWLGIEIADVTPLFADSVGLSDLLSQLSITRTDKFGRNDQCNKRR
jgi:S1-C subfamily serine protease